MGLKGTDDRGPPQNRDAGVEAGADRAELPTRQLDGKLPDEAELARRTQADHLAPTFESGAMVAHFKIMRRLGRGGMGEVYLARDTTLGRRVALKVLHPKRFGSDNARARFLFEARTTAKFNHPHIVTVYAVGEFEGRPYLALEYVEGDTLKARLEDRRLSLQESLRIGRAIAIALVEAQSHGVLHRDLKPGNVLIGRDGRVRVLDFGLAKVLEKQQANLASTAATTKSGQPAESTITTMEKRSWGVGTPQYMAPEQWRNAACGPATDVWALGALLFRMLSGRLPYNESTIVEQALAVCDVDPAPRVEQYARVPPPVGELIARCLRKDPEQRPTAAEIVDKLSEQLDAAQRSAIHQQDPFRGLLPFTSEQAHIFFGRDAEIASFVERVRYQPVLPVVGPTAAGKSSFVRAGVIPRLKEQEPWSVFYLRPGARPFQALASRLIGTDSEASHPSSPHLAFSVRSAQRLPPASPSGMVLASGGPAGLPAGAGAVGLAGAVEEDEDDLPTRVQGSGVTPYAAFEEASVGGDDEVVTTKLQPLAERLRHWPRRLSLELRAIAEERGTRVLLFVDQLEELFTLSDDTELQRAFMEALCTATDDPLDPVRVIFTLRDDFLGRVATGPQVREVLSHVTVIQRPDALALRDILVRPLEVMRYGFDDPSLVHEMVSAVADEPAALPLLQFTARVLWEHRDAQRRLLLRSVYERIGGVEGALAQHADGVLQGFSPNELFLARQLLLRLVTADRTRALVPRDQALEGLGPDAEHVLGRLTQARLVSISKQHGAPGAEPVLELAHESLIRSWSTLARWLAESQEELAFLEEARQASELWARRGRRDEELWDGDALADARRRLERSSTELPELVAAFLRASEQRRRRRNRRRRAVIASALVLSLVVAAGAVAAALFINFQRGQAEQRRAEALREGARAALGSGNVLEARAKVREALEAEDSTTARALWWRLREEPLWWTQQLGSAVYGVSFAPDNGTVAAATQSGAVYLFDSTTASTRILRGHEDHVYGVVFSPDGRLIATAGLDGTVRVWSVELGTVKRVLHGHDSGVRAVSFSPSGKLIASAGADGSTRLWDAAVGEERRTLRGHDQGVNAVGFSPDGAWLATGGADGTARLWDAHSGDEQGVLQHPGGQVLDLEFSSDGSVLATAAEDGVARLWSVPEGETKAALHGHRGLVTQLSFSPDGKMLATAGADGSLRIWDVERGEPLSAYDVGAQVRTVEFSPDGRLLASGSVDGRVGLRTVSAAALSRARGAPRAHRGPVYGAALSPDGKLLASAGQDRTIRLWDVETAAQRQVLTGHSGPVTTVAFDAEGRLLASGSEDRTVRLWDVETGSERRVLVGHLAEVRGVVFSPNGRLLATAGYDRTVRLWSVRSGVALRVLEGHTDRVEAVDFDGDGRQVASASWDRTVRLWDIGRGRTRELLRGHEAAVTGVRFAPKRDLLASSSADGTVRLWDLDEDSSSVLSEQPGRVHALGFEPNGKRIGTVGSDGIVRQWDLATKQVAELRGHRSEVHQIRFSRDGRLLATASDDGTPRVWLSESGRPYWRAPVLLGGPPRLLTHEGWLALEAGGEAELPEAKWRRAVEHHGRFATLSADGKLLCVRRYGAGVSLWDMAQDAKLVESPELAVDEVVAFDVGCVARTAEEVWLLRRNGEKKELRVAGAPTALAWSDLGSSRADGGTAGEAIPAAGGQILVAAGGEVVRFDPSGEVTGRNTIVAGVTALTLTDRYLVLGYPDGSLEMLPAAAGVDKPTFSFEKVPASPVLRLVEGPMHTLVAGYGNGLLGIWDQQDGTRLGHDRLHGPVIHLLREEGELYAATDLGSHVRWDLSAFSDDRCALLGQIWQQVPIVWERGHGVVKEPPDDHPCR